MYNVGVRTHSGYKKEYKIIEKSYAYFHFSSFIQAIDVEYVAMTDALTGELLAEYNNGKIEIFF